MKFIDDLFNLYRDQMTGDEEDAVAIVLGVLQELEQDELIQLVDQMNEDELFHMVSLYMIEIVRKKMAQEGISGTSLHSAPANSSLH